MMVIAKPQPGSSAFKLLVRLQSLGGRALLSQLLSAMPPSRQMPKFVRHELETLRDWHLVQVWPGAHCEVALTVYGSNYLLECDVALPKYVGQIVPPRTAPAFRALDLGKLMAGRPRRVGMDDCAALPSLIGSQRIAPERTE